MDKWLSVRGRLTDSGEVFDWHNQRRGVYILAVGYDSLGQECCRTSCGAWGSPFQQN